MERTFKKLLANVHVKVENLIIKLEAGDIIASAAFCNLELHSADPRQSWSPSYCECDDPHRPWLFKALTCHDVTVCLDHRGVASPTNRGNDGGSRSSSNGGGSSSDHGRRNSAYLRRFEAPLLDRATATLRFAIDVTDFLGLGQEGERGGRDGGERGGGDGNGLGITALDGIYFDPTGYSYTFDPLEDPDDAWHPLPPHDMDPHQQPPPPSASSTGPPTAPPGVKAPLVIDVHCQKIRVSLTDTQVALLSRLMEMHASARPPPPRHRRPQSSQAEPESPHPTTPANPASSLVLHHSVSIISVSFCEITLSLFQPLVQAPGFGRQRLVMARKPSDCTPLFLLEVKSLAFESQSFLTKEAPTQDCPEVSLRDVKVEVGSLRLTHQRSDAPPDVLLALVPPPSSTASPEGGSVPLWAQTAAAKVMRAQCDPPHHSHDTPPMEGDKALFEVPTPTLSPTARTRAESAAVSFITSSSLQYRSFEAVLEGEEAGGQPRSLESMDVAVTALASAVLSFRAAADAACFFEPLLALRSMVSASPQATARPGRRNVVEKHSQLRLDSLEAQLGDRFKPGSSEEAKCLGRGEKLHLASTIRGEEKIMTMEADRLVLGFCGAHAMTDNQGLVDNEAMANFAVLVDVAGMSMTSTRNPSSDKSIQQVQVSRSAKLAWRPDGAYLWKEIVTSWLRVKEGGWTPAAVSKARGDLERGMRRRLPCLRSLYYMVSSCGPSYLMDRKENGERAGEARLEGARLDQWCYRGGSVGFEADTMLAPCNGTVRWSTTTTGSAPPSTSLTVEAVGAVELRLSPLKVRGISCMYRVQEVLMPPAPERQRQGQPTKASRVLLEGPALDLVIELPWLDDSLPRLHFLGRAVRLVSGKGSDKSASYSVGCKGFTAFADLCPQTTASRAQRSQLNALAPLLKDYLTEADSDALQKALLRTPTSPPPTPSASIPVMVGQSQEAPFLVAWERSPSGRLVNLHGTVAEYDVFFYFPLYYALKRFFQGGGRRRQTKPTAEAALASASTPASPSGTLVFHPSRLLVVDGTLFEAQFGIYVHVETLSMQAARGRCSGTSLHQFIWTSELGYWSLDADLHNMANYGSFFSLEEVRPLTDRIHLTTAEDMAQGPVTCIQVSPFKFLSLGLLEMYAVNRTLNLWNSSTISAPRVPSERDSLPAKARGGLLPASSPSTSTGTMIVCPSVTLNFVDPHDLTPLLRLVFHGCEMVLEAECIKMDMRHVQLQDLRHPHGEGRGCSLTRWLENERGGKQGEGMEVDVSVVLRQSKQDGTSDMTVQLAPSELLIDVAMIPALRVLNNYVSGRNVVRKEERATRVARARRKRRRGGQAATAVSKFLSDHFRLVVYGIETAEDDGDADDRHHGQVEFTMDQVITSKRFSTKTIEYYANFVGLKSRTWAVTDDVAAFQSASMPLSDSTNVFMSMEEGRVSQDQLLYAPPPSVAAVVNADNFTIHVTQAATGALGLLYRSFMAAKASRRRCGSYDSLPGIGSRGGERCVVREMPFSHLPFHISESMSSELEGTLWSRPLPNIRECARVAHLRKGGFAHGNAPNSFSQEYRTCTLFTWAFLRPTRILSLILPENLTLYCLNAPICAYSVIWQLSTKVDACSTHEPDQPVDVPAAAVRVKGVPIRTVRDAALRARGGGEGDKVSYSCDHTLTGRVWQLSLIWHKSVELPLETIWRPLIIMLAQQVELRVFATAADEVRATLQMTLPQVDFRLYGQGTGKEGEDPHRDEVTRVRVKDLKVSCRQRRSRQEMGLVTDLEVEVVDPSRWALLPALQAGQCHVSYSTSDLLLRVSGDSKVVDVWEQRAVSVSTKLEKLNVNLSTKIALTLGRLPEVQYFSKGRQLPSIPINTSRRYHIFNTTRYNLWFGQHLTAETVKISPLSDMLYSARAMPRADSPTSSLIQEVCLRFALNMRRWKNGDPTKEREDQPSVWSEPVVVDEEGAQNLVLLTSDTAIEDDIHIVSFTSLEKSRQKVTLWVVVERQGLEVRINLHGGYQLKSYLPIPIEYRFSLEEVCLKPTSGSKDLDGSKGKAHLRVQQGPSFRLDGMASPVDLNRPFHDVPGASLLMDKVEGERLRMRVEVRRADAKEGLEEYCEAVVLDLPSCAGTACDVGSEEGTLMAPWVGTYLRKCSTAVASMAPSRSTWFLLRIRHVPVRSRRLSPDLPGLLQWGWVSIEIWPVMYLMTSGCRCRFRLTSGEGIYPPPSRGGKQAPSSSWGGTTTKSLTSKPKDVDEARRALQEKLQKLSWKKLQGTIRHEEEGADGVGGGHERNSSLDSSLSLSQDLSLGGPVWETFEVQAGQAVAVTDLDPRNGLAVNVYPNGKAAGAGMAFFINPATLLDWTRPIGSIHPLLETSSFHPLVPWIPYCQRLPAHLGPSLMLNVTPGVTAKNECPFPVSIVSLGPHNVSTTNPPTHEYFNRYTAGDFKGYDELGMVSIEAGQKANMVTWMRARASADEAWEPPPLQCAFGVTFEKDEDEDGMASVHVREARRSDQWMVQSWSRPLVLAGGIEETTVLLLKAKSLAGAQGDSLVLPIVVTLYPEAVPDNPEILRHRLVVRPRILLHNFVALPMGIGYGQLWLKAGACDKPPSRGALPFMSNMKGEKTSRSLINNSQAVLLYRRAPPVPTHEKQGSDPGWLAPDTPGREKSNASSSGGSLGFRRIWCRSNRRVNTAASDSDEEEEERTKQAAQELFAELSLHVIDPEHGRYLEDDTSGDGKSDNSRHGLHLEAGDEKVTRLTVRSERLAARGSNGKDVLRLRVGLRFHQGTHHLVLSMEPSVTLMVQNRSQYDMCLSVGEAANDPDVGSGEPTKTPNSLHISSRARVEWQPDAKAITLQSIESSFLTSGRLDDSGSGLARSSAGAQGEGAEEEAIMGFKKSSFLSRRAEVYRLRLRCHLSQQQSGWSDVFSTAERHQVVAVHFPLSEGQTPSSSNEGGDGDVVSGVNKTYALNLRVTTLACGAVSCITIDDSAMLMNRRDGGRFRPSTPVSASSLGPERSLWTDVLAVSRPAWDMSLQVSSLDLQLLDEGKALVATTAKAKKSTAGTNQTHYIHLPAFLYGRLSGLHIRLASFKTRPDTRDAPYAANVAAHAITGYRGLTVRLADFQFDNLLPHCDFPMIWRNLRPRHEDMAGGGGATAMDFQFTEAFLNQDVFGQGRPKSFVQSLSLQISRTHIALEGELLQALNSFYLSILHGLSRDGHGRIADPASRPLELTGDVLLSALVDSNNTPDPDVTLLVHELVARPRLYFESVRLGSLAVVLSARLTVPGSSVFIGLDGTPLYFDEVVLRSVVSTPSSFVRSLFANYVADTILRSPAVVGSLEILGNPTTLISRVFQGFKDLVVLSAAGSADGPLAALAGAGRGLLSLTRHIVGGTLSSLSGFSSSVKRNLEGLSPRKKSAENTPRGEKTGIGQGLLKVVTTPLSGAMEVVSWTTEQIISTTGVNQGEYAKERLVYPEGRPGVECGVDLEAFYRRRCLLNFPLGTFMGELSSLYSLNCTSPMLLATLVMAGEYLYVMTGSPGAERVKKGIALSSIHKWGYGRLPTAPPRSAALQGAHHVVEIHRKIEGEEVVRLWVQDDGARQLRAYLSKGTGQ